MSTSKSKRTREWPDVLTKQQAAEYLQCSGATIQRLTKAGRLRPYRLGQRPRYPLAMLQRFIQEGCGDHTATA